MAHVQGRLGQAAQHVDATRAVAGFFLEFAIGGLFRRFAGVDATLDQAQLVTMHAGGVLAHQQHGVVVDQRHNHHRAMSFRTNAMEAPALAVAELQIEFLDVALQRAAGSLGHAVDDRQAPAHGCAPRTGTGRRKGRHADIMAGWRKRIMKPEC